MMDNLRTAANSVVLKIIFGIIIVSFILTGVSGYLISGNSNYAAKVNGEEISRGQFENAVASERNRQQQQLGDQYSELAANENYVKAMRQQVLSRMIDEALLDQYAKKLGLGISDEQIKQAIFKEPAFQSNGKFDNARYTSIINNMGMTPDQYAQALRNQLMTPWSAPISCWLTKPMSWQRWLRSSVSYVKRRLMLMLLPPNRR